MFAVSETDVAFFNSWIIQSRIQGWYKHLVFLYNTYPWHLFLKLSQGQAQLSKWFSWQFWCQYSLSLLVSIYVYIDLKKKKKLLKIVYPWVLCTSWWLNRPVREAQTKVTLSGSCTCPSALHERRAPMNDTGQNPQRKGLPWFGQTQLSVLSKEFIMLFLLLLLHSDLLFLDLYKFKTMPFTL